MSTPGTVRSASSATPTAFARSVPYATLTERSTRRLPSALKFVIAPPHTMLFGTVIFLLSGVANTVAIMFSSVTVPSTPPSTT